MAKIIQYTPDDLVNTRFVTSPMHTLSLSAVIAFNAREYPLYSRWSQYVAEALDGIELPTLVRLVTGTDCTGDFLAPFPVQANNSFEDELQIVATMPEDYIEQELEWLTTTVLAGTDTAKKYVWNPRVLRENLINELLLYWERVMSPHWAQMRMVMEADILYRSRLIATEGYAEMMTGLSDTLTFSDRHLQIIDRHLSMVVDLDGAGIRLMPCIFTDRLRVQVSPAYRGISLTYGVRGSHNWQSPPQTNPVEALSIMVGEHRARLLHELNEPVTTQELSSRLYLTPGAVSQQLTQLSEAGLVEKMRVGKRVYYNLNDRGEKLLHVFETA